MPIETRILAVAISLGMFVMVIELVRRRRLKEEYSVLWIATSVVILVLSVWFELLLKITDVIGAVLPSSSLFFFGLAFALLMLLHFSVRVSELERTITVLVQEVGLMRVQDPPEDPEELPKAAPDRPSPVA
jgi:hypothetical protein